MTAPNASAWAAAADGRSGAFVGMWHGTVRMSPRLRWFNLGIHAVAMAVVMLLAWNRPLLTLLLPLVIGSGWHCRRGLLLQRKRSVHALCWQLDGHWLWQRRDGSEVSGRLLEATVLGRFCVLLRLQAQDRRFITTTVILASDSLPSTAHRHLRARLTLWQADRQPSAAMAWLRQQRQRLGAAL